MKWINRDKPQRGVSVYSYSSLLGECMTLEDCFKDIYDTGATCFELLSSHIDGYPNPSPEWVDKYWGLCEKYDLKPAEMGHWAETHLMRGPRMTDDEILDELVRDFKLANLLGFTTLRTKITCVNQICDPEDGWEKYLERALPYAEKYNVCMSSEVHLPTTLKTPHIEKYVEFIERTGTRHFGFNIDFGTFQNKPVQGRENNFGFNENAEHSRPKDIIPLLPYVHDCHAKFNYMNENFEEETIPYREIITTMIDNGWSGCLLSEYEGPKKDEFEFLSDQLRRQHIMMADILGY